jgi:hypothetical protein
MPLVTTIARYSSKQIAKAGLSLALFCSVSLAMTVYLAYMISKPSMYILTSEPRYSALFIACSLSLLYFGLRLAYILVVLAWTAIDSTALTREKGELRYRALLRAWTLSVDAIEGIRLLPYDRMFGRPQVVRLTTREGRAFRVASGWLEPRGEELVATISDAINAADALPRTTKEDP